jgi:hypothetical protein
MRNLRPLVISCFLVAACGQVSTLEPQDGGDDTSGSGGAVGSGGASGSGGVSGSGGISGSGGMSGSGGVSGSGGTITDASDGPAPDAADQCRNLELAYDAAMTEAKHCNPLLRIIQCQTTVGSTLRCPGCSTHVQDATKLNNIRAKWVDAGCKSGPCPAIACIAQGTGFCKATPDPTATTGMCSDERVATTQ